MKMVSMFSALLFANATSIPSNNIGIGFGTAGLGHENYEVVQMALDAGFRAFDTAEADWWYDQATVGKALGDYFNESNTKIVDDNCNDEQDEENKATCRNLDNNICEIEKLRISTKIPPWSLTSANDIRQHAKESRRELLGFCADQVIKVKDASGSTTQKSIPFPLDVYYIHAPACWPGWHPRCYDPPPTLNLRDAWLAMEAVVGLDHSANRIGLSNVQPSELLDIIDFVKERQQNNNAGKNTAPPRVPDVLQAFADPLSPNEDLQQICHEHNIEFVSYSTLGTQRREKDNYNPVLQSPVVVQLAKQYQRSTAEVVLSWALQKQMSVIPRSRQKVHIEELARLLNEPQGFLHTNDVAKIDAMKDTA